MGGLAWAVVWVLQINRDAMKAESLCRLVFLAVRTWCEFGGNCQLLVPSHWGKVLLVRQSGTVVPVLTGAVSAPWPPSHAAPAMLCM